MLGNNHNCSNLEKCLEINPTKIIQDNDDTVCHMFTDSGYAEVFLVEAVKPFDSLVKNSTLQSVFESLTTLNDIVNELKIGSEI